MDVPSDVVVGLCSLSSLTNTLSSNSLDELAIQMFKWGQKRGEEQNSFGNTSDNKRGYRDFSVDRKNAKRARNVLSASVGKCSFDVGCTVLSRRDSKIGTIIAEKAGGWRVVRFVEDSMVGRFRPSDLYSACKSCDGMRRYDEGLSGCLVSPEHGVLGSRHMSREESKLGQKHVQNIRMGDSVMIRKSRKVGLIVDEKPGGWRVVHFPDDSSGTYRPSEFVFVPTGDVAPGGVESVEVTSPLSVSTAHSASTVATQADPDVVPVPSPNLEVLSVIVASQAADEESVSPVSAASGDSAATTADVSFGLPLTLVVSTAHDLRDRACSELTEPDTM